jgi:phenylalanyl-tRNA synthetase alpha chain
MTVDELHPQAKELLKLLKNRDSVAVSTLEQAEDRSHGEVMRPAQWLEEKGLIEIAESTTTDYAITDAGEQALDEGLPEEQVLELVQGGETNIAEVQSLGEIAGPGIGKAKQNGLIEIRDGVVQLTDTGEAMLDEEHAELQALEHVRDGDDIDDEMAEILLDRGLIEQQERTDRTLTITEKGANLDLRTVQEAFNVEAEAREALVGRKHFAREVYDYIRRVWVEMGFQEMQGSIVVPGLLNFDALYTPQDHPARELHDTFFMETPEASDLSVYGSSVDWIKQTHEDGWETGSSGWQYDWSADEAAKNVLRTHTTAVSAKTLHDLTADDLPVKYFSLGRNFRNETVDWKHLAEFNQSEGIVVDPDADFRHLLGYLKRFFTKLGYADVRFRPAYYPYTELSVEVDVYDDVQEEWVGLGGAGMFRPEVVKPLLGFEAPVLAWGLGPGRIIMRKHDLTDIRDMYRNDLDLLRNTEGWLQ